jgi:hypothetical protein
LGRQCVERLLHGLAGFSFCQGHVAE